MAQLIVLVAMFALLWLFLIAPQRRRAQAQRELIASVEVGDEILTVGGLIGRVRSAQDEELVLEIAPGTRGPGRAARGRRRAVARGREQARRSGLGIRAGRGSPQLTYRSLDEPQTAPHSRRADRRRAHRGRPARRSRLAAPPGADARPRPPGRPRGDAPGGAAAEPQAAEVRPDPVGRDPARPHRPARRRRARDPRAGRRPDLDPAPGHQEPGAGDRDPRPDGAARALRPRGEPRSALDRRPELPGGDRVAVRAARRPAGPRRGGQERVLVPLRRQQEEGRRPGDREGQAAPEQGGRGGRREGQAAEGLEDLRRAAEDRRAHVRHRRGRLPGRQRREPDQQLLLSRAQRRVQDLGRREDGAGDDEATTSSSPAPARTSTRRRASRS